MAHSHAHKKTGSEYFIAHSPEFHEVTGDNPKFYTVIETNAHEGPVYIRDEQALYFTTVPANSNVPVADSKQVQIKRIDLNTKHFPLDGAAAVVISDASNMANGMTLDREGRLVICEQGTKATWARLRRMDLTTG
jgi:gluconolactonase